MNSVVQVISVAQSLTLVQYDNTAKANEFYTTTTAPAADDHQHREMPLFNGNSPLSITPVVQHLVLNDDGDDHMYNTGPIPLAVSTTTPADRVVDVHSKNPLLQMNGVYGMLLLLLLPFPDDHAFHRTDLLRALHCQI